MRKPNNPALALMAVLALAAPLAAQAPAPAPAASPLAAGAPDAASTATLPAGDVYRREVFRYQRGGRPDPFQPLLTAAELGFRVEDLRLTAIIYSPDARRSVAVFAEGDSARRYRLHQGQRLGTMTVTRIWPQRVDVRVDEFGGSRLQTVLLQRTARQQQAVAADQAPAAQQIPVTIAPAAQPAAPRVLRRGAQASPPAAPAPQRSVNPRSPTYTTTGHP
ncbi:hypothetical protein [Longimicrobium sp.]|uniref:hypothetical protein n=1 Tax=Longimicrobium sp. TaxID=2029185 RepID=UPI002BF47656|nr:hypothetical protein [Longimicrobium sp.]HSU13200.1 hypothetical protein [Longimicrobium sp.]